MTGKRKSDYVQYKNIIKEPFKENIVPNVDNLHNVFSELSRLQESYTLRENYRDKYIPKEVQDIGHEKVISYLKKRHHESYNTLLDFVNNNNIELEKRGEVLLSEYFSKYTTANSIPKAQMKKTETPKSSTIKKKKKKKEKQNQQPQQKQDDKILNDITDELRLKIELTFLLSRELMKIYSLFEIKATGEEILYQVSHTVKFFVEINNAKGKGTVDSILLQLMVSIGKRIMEFEEIKERKKLSRNDILKIQEADMIFTFFIKYLILTRKYINEDKPNDELTIIRVLLSRHKNIFKTYKIYKNICFSIIKTNQYFQKFCDLFCIETKGY